METVIENQQFGYATTSTLSAVVGPGLLTEPTKDAPPREDVEFAPFDTFSWMDRLVDLTALKGFPNGVPFGPSVTSSTFSNFLADLMLWPQFVQGMEKFVAFSYESITYRITISNPKNIVGAYYALWFPYVDYFDEGVVGTVQAWTENQGNEFALMNSTNCQLGMFASPSDITITVPWTYKYQLFYRAWMNQLTTDGSQNGRPPVGSPILLVKKLPGTSFVSTIGNNGNMRIYMKVNGLRFYGPEHYADALAGEKSTQLQSGHDVIEKHTILQSGVEEVLGAAAIATAADAGLGYISEEFFGEKVPDGSNPFTAPRAGNYDNPQAVQLSYFGDTTSVDYPQTRPIFQDGVKLPKDAPVPSVHDYLTRPQMILNFTTTSLSHTVRNSPSYPTGADTAPFVQSASTYFRYFGMINRFWRGTINFHFIIAGHQFVEVEAQFSVTYDATDPNMPPNPNLFQDVVVHRSVFSGGKHIVVPAPFLSCRDYVEVDEGGNQFYESNEATCYIHARIRVISTMLDLDPVIPVYVFMSAGPDFKFYQPYPPGLYNVRDFTESALSLEGKQKEEENLTVEIDEKIIFHPSTKKRNPNEKHTILQVGLPFTDEMEIASTRARVLPDPGILPSFDDLYSYMKIWSRIVPFEFYDSGEEPVPLAEIGCISPCWYPPVDRSRDYQQDNSWYFTLDYTAYLSHLFLYWRGSLGIKAAAASNRSATDQYLYIALSGNHARADTHCPFGMNQAWFPPQANFGTGSVVTPLDKQPVIEATIPYRGENIWSYTIWQAYGRGVTRFNDFTPPRVKTNLELVNDDEALADAMYRKIDSDFALCVESTLPPPAFWIHRGTSYELS